jgi:MFS family permease
VFGLPRNIVVLGLTSLFNDLSSEMVYAVFPAFFTTVLNAGAQSLGLVDGVAEATSNIFKIYSGHLSDRFQRRKPLVVAGYTLSVLTRPVYVLVSSVPGALLLRFLDRIGKGFRDSPRDAILSLSTERSAVGKAFGYHRAMDTVGAILGPLIAYLLLRRFPARFDFIFLSAFVAGIVAVCTLLFISDVVVTARRDRGAVMPSLKAFSSSFRIYLVSVLVLSAGTLPAAILLLKTTAIHLMVADIPLFYMIYNVAYAIFSIPAGVMSDKFGPRVIISIGCGFLLISYAALALATSAFALAVGFFLLGLYPALTDGVQRSLTSQMTSETSRGAAFGLMNGASGIGALIAGIGGGYFWQTIGPVTALLAAATLVVIGLFLLLISSLVMKPQSV